MPTFLLIAFTIAILAILLAGIVNFPYVPMWFGVYDAERYTQRGKLVSSLIWLFPPIAIASLIVGWYLSSLFVLLPVVYFIVVWMIRPNKVSGRQPEKRYSDFKENIESVERDIGTFWQDWLENSSEKNFLLIRFFAPSNEALETFIEASKDMYSRIGELEISNYENGSASVYIQVLLEELDRESVSEILTNMTKIAWISNCEVWSFDVLESSQ